MLSYSYTVNLKLSKAFACVVSTYEIPEMELFGSVGFGQYFNLAVENLHKVNVSSRPVNRRNVSLFVEDFST